MNFYNTPLISIPKIGIDAGARTIIMIIVITIILMFKFFIRLIIEKKIDDQKKVYKLKKFVSYFTYIIIIFIAGTIWSQDFSQLIAFLSAGLAITLKEPIENIFGWLFIVIRKPFDVGDRIQLGDNAGDVIDIRMFEFTIMEIGNWVELDQSTGRMIHIPNGKIFRESLANYNRGFKYIWNEIEVIVTFESDYKKAKEIILNIANRYCEKVRGEARENLKEVSKKYMIYYNKITPIVYTEVRDSGVALLVRYLCKPQKRRVSTSLIWEEILDRFNEEENIDFAYNTQRVIRE